MILKLCQILDDFVDNRYGKANFFFTFQKVLVFFFDSVSGSLEEGELSEEELEQKRKALLRELQENS